MRNTLPLRSLHQQAEQAGQLLKRILDTDLYALAAVSAPQKAELGASSQWSGCSRGG